MSFSTINPSTHQVIHQYPFLTPNELEHQLSKAQDRFHHWRRTSFEERATLLNNAAQLLLDNKNTYAQLITQEMGKVLPEAISEIEKCAWVCRYYATHAAQLLANESQRTEAIKSYIHYQPLGPILAIMPWNFPFWQVFRFAAPTLMAGNTTLLKPAPNVPACALAIEQIFREAGFPEGCFGNLFIDTNTAGDVIKDPRVKGVALTGSGRAGQVVAAIAGQALKPSVLELGGSDPFIVLADADVEKAAEICVQSRLRNAGQSCIGAKRIIAVQEVYGEVVNEVFDLVAKVKAGDPMEKGIDIGPMARADLRDKLQQQVEGSVASGARCLIGGQLIEGVGNYYPATMLTDVKPGMPAFEEELFGPVFSVIPAKNEIEAIQLANASSFGLGGAIFTADVVKGERIAAEELEAGCCFVNSPVKSDPRFPFGGIKRSGYGRELGAMGIKAFVNAKTVWVEG